MSERAEQSELEVPEPSKAETCISLSPKKFAHWSPEDRKRLANIMDGMGVNLDRLADEPAEARDITLQAFEVGVTLHLGRALDVAEQNHERQHLGELMEQAPGDG